VWSVFRDFDRLKDLAHKTPLGIELFDLEFSHRERSRYHDRLVEWLGSFSRQRRLLFLDPDNGIEPETASAAHVKVEEIKLVWSELKSGDWLAVYQHRNRDRDWDKSAMLKFATACSRARPLIIRSEKIASDVILLAARKP
jgi:hypothetical protein